MKIIICSINENLIKVIKDEFLDTEINVICDNIFDLDIDTIVSPVNSFGFMDGSLDWHISENIGWDIQGKLQNIIKDKYNGELLVGQAEIIETTHDKIKYVISAPSMRVPMLIKNTVNCYLATKATFILIKNDTRINNVAIPCFGTGVGGLQYKICAKQMRKAYDDVFGTYKFPKSWQQSVTEHERLLI